MFLGQQCAATLNFSQFLFCFRKLTFPFDMIHHAVYGIGLKCVHVCQQTTIWAVKKKFQTFLWNERSYWLCYIMLKIAYGWWMKFGHVCQQMTIWAVTGLAERSKTDRISDDRQFQQSTLCHYYSVLPPPLISINSITLNANFDFIIASAAKIKQQSTHTWYLSQAPQAAPV